MLDIRFSYKDYSKILRSDVDDFMLTKPMFIPLDANVYPYIYKNGVVWCPSVKATSMSKLPKAIKELGEKSEYVIFTEDMILGTDEFVLCNFYDQPREEASTWIVADRADDKITWFKEYGTSCSISDFFASFFITRVDTICNDKALQTLGKGIYEEIYKGILGCNWVRKEAFDILFEVNAADFDSPFYSYKVRKLLERGI